MGTTHVFSSILGRNALLAAFSACAILSSATLASAQNGAPPDQANKPGFLSEVGRWFEGLGSGLRGAQSGVENLGHEAGVAARSTVEDAKNAAGAVTGISNTRLVKGHEVCAIAPNGAPDCVAAANAICKGKGFASGKSVDMTTAEVCPAKVYLAGRNSGADCHTETFVSRAVCQ